MSGTERPEFTIIRKQLNTFADNALGVVSVYVDSAPSPDAVVLQRLYLMRSLKVLESAISSMYEELTHRYPDQPNPKEIKKGRCYAIYSTRKRRWVRARAEEDIKNVTVHSLLVRFWLEDYCVDEHLLPNRVRYLPDSLCELPAVGYLACQSDPFGDTRVWTPAESFNFRDLILGKYFPCKVIKYHPEKQINMVEFYVEADGNNGSDTDPNEGLFFMERVIAGHLRNGSSGQN